MQRRGDFLNRNQTHVQSLIDRSLRSNEARRYNTVDSQRQQRVSTVQARGQTRFTTRNSFQRSSQTSLVVYNLNYTVTVRELTILFSQVGKVINVRIIRDANGKSTGVAHVTFAQAEDAARAFREYNSRYFYNRVMQITIGDTMSSTKRPTMREVQQFNHRLGDHANPQNRFRSSNYRPNNRFRFNSNRVQTPNRSISVSYLTKSGFSVIRRVPVQDRARNYISKFSNRRSGGNVFSRLG